MSDREQFTITVPEGFAHDARVHEPVTFDMNTPPKYRVLTPLHELATGCRVGRAGQLSANSTKQPLLMIGNHPAEWNNRWTALVSHACDWRFPVDSLLKGMGLTVAVERYEYVPKYIAPVPGEDAVKHALALLAVRIDSDIPNIQDHEPLQEWVRTRRAFWSR